MTGPPFICPTDGYEDLFAFTGWPPEGGSLIQCESCLDRWRVTLSADGALAYEPAAVGWLPAHVLDEEFTTRTEYEFLDEFWTSSRGRLTPYEFLEAVDEYRAARDRDSLDGLSWPNFLSMKIAA